MYDTVEQAADAIAAIMVEKTADWRQALSNIGGQIKGFAGKADQHVRNFTGNNDAARWALYGGLGLGGAGAIKGLVAPTEGRGRLRSMASNAGLGALLGAAGGGAAGIAVGKNPMLGGGNLFGGDTEKHEKLLGKVNGLEDERATNYSRLIPGVGPDLAALNELESGNFAGAGREALKPFTEAAGSPISGVLAPVAGSQVARRWNQMRLYNRLTPPDTAIAGANPLPFSVGRNPGPGYMGGGLTLGRNPNWKANLGELLSPAGHLSGTAAAQQTIGANSLQSTVNNLGANGKLFAPPGPPLPAGATPPVLSHTSPGLVRNNLAGIRDELAKSLPGGGGGGGGKPDPSTFFKPNVSTDFTAHLNTPQGVSALDDAVTQGKDFKFNTRVKLPGSRLGAPLWAAAGINTASTLRNLPGTVGRIRQIGMSGGSGELGEAENALSGFEAQTGRSSGR